MKYADRMVRLGTETAFEVLARAKALEAEGREIVHLEIGEPDFDTPSHITEAAVTALRGRLGRTTVPRPGYRNCGRRSPPKSGARATSTSGRKTSSSSPVRSR